MSRCPKLAISPSCTHTDPLVSLDGVAYALPERGSDLTLRLRGRGLSRYPPCGIDRDFGSVGDAEGVILVERVLSSRERAGPGGVLQFEGFVERLKGAPAAYPRYFHTGNAAKIEYPA